MREPSGLPVEQTLRSGLHGSNVVPPSNSRALIGLTLAAHGVPSQRGTPQAVGAVADLLGVAARSRPAESENRITSAVLNPRRPHSRRRIPGACHAGAARAL
jgi:hypothetical protein